MAIDKTAVIDPSARVADEVTIGAWSVIGPSVEIGRGCRIGSHVIIEKNTKLGKNNRISPFAYLGGDPQDMHYQDEQTFLEIGDDNIIREYVTMHRGSVGGDGVTRVGNHNLFLAYSHVAHDCCVGNEVSMINNATLAGHVTVDDYAILGAFCAVHQHCRIGSYSFSTRVAIVTKDIPPYMLVTGIPAVPCGLNIVGLKRRGFTKTTIKALHRAYSLIYREQLPLKVVRERLAEMAQLTPEIQLIIDIMEQSQRGISRIRRKQPIEDQASLV